MIYRQTRVGLDGAHFEILKLRTMDEDGEVTRPWLRHLGLDELPQLWNVLRGEMALFGPRPEVPDRDRLYWEAIPEWRERYAAKPGLLGLAQVRGTVRGPDRFTLERKREQARLDAELVTALNHPLRGLLVRLRILLRLPAAVLAGQRS